MLEFLNQNNGAFSVIFSAAVAFATIMYAILTWKLVSETKKMREVQTEPNISVFILPREEGINFLDMVIQNIGMGPAYNIKFKIEPDFEYITGSFLSQFGYFKNGLEYLAPSQKLQFFFTYVLKIPKEKKNPFNIHVTYENINGKSYKNNYTIDISSLEGLLQLGEPAIQQLAKNIEEIKNILKKMRGSTS